jgi:cation transport regulator ChaC
VPEPERERTLAELDRREQGGYERLWLTAHFGDASGGDAVRALAYVALPSNPGYLGAASLAAIAAQVREARGPSGSNLDYVVRLARALRSLGVEDDHVLEVATELELEPELDDAAR